MLNIYKYYDDASALPLYSTIAPALAIYKDLDEWTPYNRKALKPLEHMIARDPKKAYYYAEYVLQGRFPEGEQTIKKYPNIACKYAQWAIRGRWLDAEPYIIKHAEQAYQYAFTILAKDKEWTSQPGHENGRWPEAEPLIMQEPQRAWLYCLYVVKKRWPEAEPIIESDDYYWNKYKKEYGIE